MTVSGFASSSPCDDFGSEAGSLLNGTWDVPFQLIDAFGCPQYLLTNNGASFSMGQIFVHISNNAFFCGGNCVVSMAYFRSTGSTGMQRAKEWIDPNWTDCVNSYFTGCTAGDSTIGDMVGVPTVV